MLETGPLGDEHGDSKPHAAADAVSKPHRCDACVLDRELLRRLQRGAHLLRLHDVALIEFLRLASRCEQCVTGDLSCGKRRCPDSKRRLERRGNHVDQWCVVGQPRQPSHECVRDGVTGSVQAGEVDLRVVAFEPGRARAEHFGR